MKTRLSDTVFTAFPLVADDSELKDYHLDQQPTKILVSFLAYKVFLKSPGKGLGIMHVIPPGDILKVAESLIKDSQRMSVVVLNYGNTRAEFSRRVAKRIGEGLILADKWVKEKQANDPDI